MSRTFRRVETHIIRRIIKDVLEVRGFHNCYGWPRDIGKPYYEGKEIEQRFAHAFSDSYTWHRYGGNDASKWTRKQTQKKYRAESKVKLSRFTKDPDYEVIIPRKNLLPWD